MGYGHFDETRKHIDEFNTQAEKAEAIGHGYLSECVMENIADEFGPEPMDRDGSEAAEWWKAAAEQLEWLLDSGDYV